MEKSSSCSDKIAASEKKCPQNEIFLDILQLSENDALPFTTVA